MANNKIKLHLFLIISSFLLTKDLNLLLLPKIILLFLLTSLYFNLIINKGIIASNLEEEIQITVKVAFLNNNVSL